MALQHDLNLIQSLEEELLKQPVRGSPEAVSTLLAENFIEFGRSGAVYRKEEVIRGLAAELDEVNSPARAASDFELRSLADDVVLLPIEASEDSPPVDRSSTHCEAPSGNLLEGAGRWYFIRGLQLSHNSQSRSLPSSIFVAREGRSS